MSVGLDWKSKGPCETEISQLNVLSGRVNQEVLGLQITVENSVLMQVD